MKFISISKYILLILFVLSCASEKPTGKTAAEVLYKEAKELMADGRYILATEKLNQIKSQYPYSFYATHSELLLADVLFMQESYVEAAAAYLVFKDFHPKYKDTEYVIFKIADSYFKQIPDTFDRDLTSAHEAIKYFEELNSRFPANKHEAESKEKMAKCKDMIRSKEKYIADFYFKTKVYKAARYRYLKIMREFTDANLLDHAMKRIVMSSLKAGEPEKCESFYKKFSEHLTDKSKKELVPVVKKCIK